MNTISHIAICPSCHEPDFVNRLCKKCGFKVELLRGIVDLRTDKSFDTILDVENYDASHGVTTTPTTSTELSDGFCKLIAQAGRRPGGSVLEIACGSGLLTSSILASGQFSEVHCGDISNEFMFKLEERVKNISTQTKTYKYLFDANSLPFKNESFDYVFGNSVLHHFANFENTIRDAYRVLKKGGAAVFGEPVLDTHIFVSLAAGLILRASKASATSPMSPEALTVLDVIRTRGQVKINNLYSDRRNLAEIEDKFQFPVKYLEKLARDVGFETTIFASSPAKMTLGGEAKKGIVKVFDQQKLDWRVLEEYQYIFDALSEDYGKPMSLFMTPLFSNIAFIKT